MNPFVFLSALGVWFILLIIAILNAGFRTKVLEHRMTELRAHQAASLLYIAVLFAISYVYVLLLRLSATMLDFMIIGTLWVSLTIVFEFLFGHYVMNHPWERLFKDYDLRQGRLWALVVASILTAPILMGFILL